MRGGFEPAQRDVMLEISATLPQGLCPSCEASGPVGAPCAERVCERQGIAFIPEPDARDALATATGDREALIGRFIGDFLITKRLGKGGFGRVLLGLQRPLFKLKGAVKLLEFHGADASVNEALARKFESEAASLAVLHSPHVVRLLQFGTFDGRPFMAMEFVPGGRTLRHLAGLPGDPALTSLPHDTIRRIIAETLSGLEAAHTQGIIHRDVKPDNIMLQDVVGNSHFVKIVDFGLAKSMAANTDTSHVFGTIQYMAPEQIERGSLGPWTDLYAVGVIAFELLLGRRPYRGADSQSIMLEKLNPLFDPLGNVKPGELEPDGVSFFRRALARDPARRFQSAASFRQAWLALFGAPAAEPAPTRSPVSLVGAPPSPDTIPDDVLSADSPDVQLALAGAAPPAPVQVAAAPPAWGARKRRQRRDEADRSTVLELQPAAAGAALPIETGAPPELARAARASEARRARWPLVAGIGLSALGVATTALVVAALQHPAPPPSTAFAEPSNERSEVPGPAAEPASAAAPLPVHGGVPPKVANTQVEADVLPISPPTAEAIHEAEADTPTTPTPPEVPTANAIRMTISSTPDGAAVSVDGVEVGAAPFVLHTEAGRSHRLRLTAPGHLPSERALVASAETSAITITLEPEARRRPSPTPRRPRASDPRASDPRPAPAAEDTPPAKPAPGALTPIYIDE